MLQRPPSVFLDQADSINGPFEAMFELGGKILKLFAVEKFPAISASGFLENLLSDRLEDRRRQHFGDTDEEEVLEKSIGKPDGTSALALPLLPALATNNQAFS